MPKECRVDLSVPCNGSLRTVSGPEGSSTKQCLSCVAGVPAMSVARRNRSLKEFEGRCTALIYINRTKLRNWKTTGEEP